MFAQIFDNLFAEIFGNKTERRQHELVNWIVKWIVKWTVKGLQVLSVVSFENNILRQSLIHVQ